MAQFDVHRDPFAPKKSAGYVIELQHDLFGEVDFVLLAPFVGRRRVAQPISVLNPVLEIEGEDFVLLTQQIVSVRRNVLKAPVANLLAERYAILRAIDMMFTGI